MKKFLPIVVLILGIVVLVVAAACSKNAISTGFESIFGKFCIKT